MALKFLNKKGWHTGSLRNIENVWKAEQKHEAEQKKLEELRKQIQEEKERSEFRRLQEQAGLVPRQERLEFLYDSGLSVGKSSSDGGGFKSLEALPQSTNNEVGASSSSGKQQDAVPGALFEEKQHSANDAWRKLHSDPLLMIRQREQDALARIKNNPVKMAMIRKSVESKKREDDVSEHKKAKRKHRKHSSSKNQSDSEDDDRKHRKHASSKPRSNPEDGERKHRKHASSKHRSDSEDDDRKSKRHSSTKYQSDSEDDARKHRKQASSKHRSDSEDDDRKGKRHSSTKYRSDSADDARKHRKQASSKHRCDSEDDDTKHRSLNYKEHTESNGNSRGHRDLERETKQQRYRERSPVESREERGEYRRQMKSHHEPSKHENPQEKDERTDKPAAGGRYDSGLQHRRRNAAPKLSEEERAARLREMQRDAEVHEELRWKRLKKVDESDAREATRNVASGGKTFLDAAHKSVYGAEQGGSATIEESVRRRSHFLQSRSSATEGNAFRR